MLVNNYFLLLIGMAAELFIILCFLAYIHTAGRQPLNGDGSRNMKHTLLLIAVTTIGGVATSRFLSFSGEYTYINIINFIALATGLIGGPWAGLATGTLLGLEEFLIDGTFNGPSYIAYPLIGLFGGLVWHFSGRTFPRVSVAVLSMAATEFVYLVITWLITPDRFLADNLVIEIASVQSDINILSMVIMSIVYSSKILLRDRYDDAY